MIIVRDEALGPCGVFPLDPFVLTQAMLSAERNPAGKILKKNLKDFMKDQWTRRRKCKKTTKAKL